MKLDMELAFEWEFSDSPAGDVYLLAQCAPCTTRIGALLPCAGEHRHDPGATHDLLFFELGQDPGRTVVETPPVWPLEHGDDGSFVNTWVDMIETTVANYTPYVIAHLEGLLAEHQQESANSANTPSSTTMQRLIRG